MDIAVFENKMKAIADYLDQSLICFLDVKNKEESLFSLVDLLDKNKRLFDKQMFYKAILEREKIVSTGIGMGVAIPHAKLHGFTDFFIAVAIQKNRGIEWDSIDKAPVHIIFMIGGPDNKQTEYLQVLSLLTMVIKNEKVRKALIAAASEEEVMRILSKF